MATIQEDAWSPKSYSIPDYWLYTSLETAFLNLPLSGKKLAQKQYEAAGEFPVIDQGELLVGGRSNDRDKLLSLDRPVVVFGDHTRCIKYVTFDFIPGADGIKVLQPANGVDAKYGYYACKSLRLPNRGYSRHYSFLKKCEFPLPPLNEQKRIVAKIEELFSELDKGIESLQTAREQLKVYRQAVLKHAFEGKLTEQWRRDNADKLESPEQLLARIQQERDARYQQQLGDWKTAVKEWEANGKEGKKPGKPKLNSYSQQLDLAALPSLPDKWGWVELSRIMESIQIGPFGSLLHKSDYVVDGIPLINPSHIKNQKIVPDWNLTVTEEKLSELAKYAMQNNDIVIGRRGEMGRCAVVTEKEAGWLCGTGSLFIRPLNIAHPVFYSWIIASQRVRDFLSNSSIGTTMQNLNEKILKGVPVPVCSIDEQYEIVRQISSQYSVIDKLESEISDQLAKAETLRQSILKKAFSGQLVPQDPTDEPASELLARIQAEKAALSAKAKKTPAKRGRKVKEVSE